MTTPSMVGSRVVPSGCLIWLVTARIGRGELFDTTATARPLLGNWLTGLVRNRTLSAWHQAKSTLLACWRSVCRVARALSCCWTRS